MRESRPHKCGECFNPYLEAGNRACSRLGKQRVAGIIARRKAKAEHDAMIAAAVKEGRDDGVPVLR